MPHLTLMVGASYGAGNYGMSGRAYDPRFVFSWPNNDEATDAQVRTTTEAMIEAQSGAVYATGRGWDDGVIDPRDTRTVLGLALSAVHSAPVAGSTAYAPFRM